MTNRHVMLLWLALVVPGALLAVAAHLLPLSPVDVALTAEVQERRAVDVLLTPLMLGVSLPGDYPWAGLLVGLACVISLLRRRWRESALILSTVTGDGMALIVKALVQRPRPSPDLVGVYEQLQHYSFPSGHVVHYVVFFGAVSYLACEALRSLPSMRKEVRVPLVAIVVVFSMLVMLIGISRVYLGAHWMTDVVGGYLLGGAWLLGLLAAYRRWLETPDQRITPSPTQPLHNAITAAASATDSWP